MRLTVSSRLLCRLMGDKSLSRSMIGKTLRQLTQDKAYFSRGFSSLDVHNSASSLVFLRQLAHIKLSEQNTISIPSVLREALLGRKRPVVIVFRILVRRICSKLNQNTRLRPSFDQHHLMTSPQEFCASIQIPSGEHGRIITDRIACRSSTRMLAASGEDLGAASIRIRQYRRTMLQMLYEALLGSETTQDEHQATQLVQKFIKLAAILADSKAIAFPLNIGADVGDPGAVHQTGDGKGEEAESSEEFTATVAKAEPNSDDKECKLSEKPDHVASSDSREDSDESAAVVGPHEWRLESLAHPLSIFILAYHFGGPVNAANTARRHAWTCPQDSGAPASEFHIEGDGSEMFDDVRLTLVWETQGSKATRPSGDHTIFMASDASPTPLITLKSTEERSHNFPLNIMYDPKYVTMYYDCQDPEVSRNSVSLDFHLNCVRSEDLLLLTDIADEQHLEKLNLTTLITNFPVVNYTAHFQGLLYSKDSMTVIISKLAALHVPMALPASTPVGVSVLEHLDAYNQDNMAHIPSTIASTKADVPIAGRYATTVGFLESICMKARRDVHLSLGKNMVPRNTIARKREAARKLVRDLPEKLISTRLANYASVLTSTPYTSQDLLTTSTLREVARSVERHCLELVALGFVDDAVDMSSMAALASTLGAAIDGIKEIEVNLEPWIDGADLQVLRTRCLYLFWCVDWFVCYLVKPAEGPFMLLDGQKVCGHLSTIRQEMVQTAHALLRNWVAWGLFVEDLPQGGFFVRQPSSGH